MGRSDERLAELGIALPPPGAQDPAKPYARYVLDGRHLYVSGNIPDIAGEPPLRGTVGVDLDVEAARAAAVRVTRNLLGVMRDATGDLDRVERIVKVLGLVQAAPDFTQHPAVVNAASEIFVALWGEDRGRGARSAFGVASLPLGVPVEIELIALLSA